MPSPRAVLTRRRGSIDASRKINHVPLSSVVRLDDSLHTADDAHSESATSVVACCGGDQGGASELPMRSPWDLLAFEKRHTRRTMLMAKLEQQRNATRESVGKRTEGLKRAASSEEALADRRESATTVIRRHLVRFRGRREAHSAEARNAQQHTERPKASREAWRELGASREQARRVIHHHLLRARAARARRGVRRSWRHARRARAAGEGQPQQHSMLLDLPDVLISHVATHLAAQDLASLAQTSRACGVACEDALDSTLLARDLAELFACYEAERACVGVVAEATASAAAS